MVEMEKWVFMKSCLIYCKIQQKSNFSPKYALAYKGSDIYMKETGGWRAVFPSVPRRPPIVFYQHLRSSTFATLV